MTKREELALTILKEGGYFRKQLETGYQGREKFKERLRDKNGRVVAGVGGATLYKFEREGLLKKRACPSSSVWPTEWVLKNTH